MLWQYRMCDDVMALSNELVYGGRLRSGSKQVAEAELSLPGLAEWKKEHRMPHWLAQVGSKLRCQLSKNGKKKNKKGIRGATLYFEGGGMCRRWNQREESCFLTQVTYKYSTKTLTKNSLKKAISAGGILPPPPHLPDSLCAALSCQTHCHLASRQRITGETTNQRRPFSSR